MKSTREKMGLNMCGFGDFNGKIICTVNLAPGSSRRAAKSLSSVFCFVDGYGSFISGTSVALDLLVLYTYIKDALCVRLLMYFSISLSSFIHPLFS